MKSINVDGLNNIGRSQYKCENQIHSHIVIFTFTNKCIQSYSLTECLTKNINRILIMKSNFNHK